MGTHGLFVATPRLRSDKKAAADSAAWRAAAAVIPAVAAASGVLNLLSLLGGPVPSERPIWLWNVLPFDFVGLPRSVTLLGGLVLVLDAVHLWSRKRRALQLALGLACASLAYQLTRPDGFSETLSSAALIALIVVARRVFPVRSARPTLLSAVRRGLIALSVPFLYGVAGFWLLDRREFGKNFHWWDAAIRTIRVLTFIGDETLLPRTHYAVWFLDSVTLIAFASFIYVILILFRPVAYRFHFEPFSRERAAEIVSRYGRSAQDFFKHYSDKSYFFSPSGESFIAYRVAGNFAVAFGDPVGPDDELQDIIERFASYCRERGWAVAFHQVFPDRLPVYRALGFRQLKIGDDAVVDLRSFSLTGSAMKEFRNAVNRLKRAGYRVERLDPPIPDRTIEQLKSVSDAWLRLPGHRERRFTLGKFDPEYVRSTVAYAAIDSKGRVAAFVNLVPSYSRGLASVDLMRRRPDAPNGIMDFLFAEMFMELKSQGYERFNLGMAPLAEFRDGERQTIEERLLRSAIKRMPFLFRADTLRRFKAKYASHWEPRYSVYRTPLDLPKLALALRRVSELEHAERTA